MSILHLISAILGNCRARHNHYGSTPNKYKYHQGVAECARLAVQLRYGNIHNNGMHK